MRRGQAELIAWFPRIILMAVAVIVIVMLVRVYTNRDADSPVLERETYLYRLYYDSIIMYEDSSTGRVYPGIVDAQKVTSENLNSVFWHEGDWAKISSMITLNTEQGCPIAPVVAYNSRETYERYLPFTDVLSAGGATREDVIFPVTVRGTTACAGWLNISIVRPNS